MSHELMSPAEYQLHQLQEWLKVDREREAMFFITEHSEHRFCVALNASEILGYGPTIADAIADALRQVK